MKNIEHIGIAVKDLTKSITLFEELLDTACYKTETVESEKVRTAFFQKRETKVELLESFDENGVIANFINKRGEGIHHIAFEVENIEKEIGRLRSKGFDFVSETPKKGADNKRVCFLHPRTTNGVLIELC